MLKIVTYPESILRRRAEDVDDVDDEIIRLIEDMSESMYADDGAGLAAPQVGVSKRVIVMDAGYGLKSYINPVIRARGDEVRTVDEGCLSLPGIRVDVSRPSRIVVSAMNENGDTVEVEAEGLLARVFQHEIDHINGILIIDHASSIQRSLLKSRLRRFEK